MAGATIGTKIKGYIAEAIITEAYVAQVYGANAEGCRFPLSSNGGRVCGIAQYTTLANNDHVDVMKEGISKVIVDANSVNISRGDLVVVGGVNGHGVKATDRGSATFGTGNAAGTFTATPKGLAGDMVTVRLIDPNGNNQSLTITVDGSDVAVSLATGNTGSITTTPALLLTAWNANAQALELATFAVGGTGGSAIAVALTGAGYSVQVTGASDISQGYLIGTAEESATSDGQVIAVTLAGGL